MIPNPGLLWALVILAYGALSFRILARLDGLPYVLATSLSSVLVSSAFSFKLDFTSEDAPELVVGYARRLNDVFQGQSLLWRARTVFMLTAAIAAYGIFRAVTRRAGARLSSSKLLVLSGRLDIWLTAQCNFSIIYTASSE